MKRINIYQTEVFVPFVQDIKVITPKDIFKSFGVGKGGIGIDPYPFNHSDLIPDSPSSFSVEVTVVSPDNFNVELI